MVNNAFIGSAVRSVRRGNRRLATLIATTCLLLPAVAGAWQTMDVVWNVGDADCVATPMASTGPGVWNAATLLPLLATGEPTTVRFQFMVDGSMQPAYYGKDLLRDWGVVFGANPPAVVASVSGPGYWMFVLDETNLNCILAPAPGLIRAAITYLDTPTPVAPEVLEATRAAVRDLTTTAALGEWTGANADGQLAIGGLLSGRSYELTFSAPGYRATTVTVEVPDATPRDIMVSMQKLVAAEAGSWGAIKNTYR